MLTQMRVLTAAMCFIASAGAAVAHVSLEAKEAKLGSGYKAVFNIPHGCKGSPTTEVRIDIPEGVIAVKPMPKAGWAISMQKGPYARTYGFYHGETKSEGVKQVAWSGGELPDEYFDQFVLSTFIAAELPAGTKVTFPVTQKCANGEMAWNQVAADGQDAHSLEFPAPQLSLVAGEAEHHHHGAEAAKPAGDIAVTGAWTRPASEGGMGVGYMTIANTGKEPDVLLGGASDGADRVEVHETTIDDKGVASMKKLGEVTIEPGKSIELKPGGMHLMLVGLKAPIADGGTFKLKLNFKKAGAVDVELPAQGGAPTANADHEHMHHQH
jgi:periplasmic copper chaperone A